MFNPRWSFEDAHEAAALPNAMEPDPLKQILQDMQACHSLEELDQILFPDRASENLKTKEQVYETVRSWILDALQDERTHIAISRGFDFDLRLTTAEPVAVAALTLGKCKGQCGEAVLALAECNLGITEAPGTVITHNSASKHCIGTNQSTLIGSDSSSKKSNLSETSNIHLKSEAALDEFKNMAVFLTDATTRATRDVLKEKVRCLVSSDEGANTFQVEESDLDSGIHFLSKAKCNTWTQSEFVAPST